MLTKFFTATVLAIGFASAASGSMVFTYWEDVSAGRSSTLIFDAATDSMTSSNTNWGTGAQHWTLPTGNEITYGAFSAGYVQFDLQASHLASNQALIDSGFGTTWAFMSIDNATDRNLTREQDYPWEQGTPTFNSFSLTFGRAVGIPGSNLIIFQGNGVNELDQFVWSAQTSVSSGGSFIPDQFAISGTVPEPSSLILFGLATIPMALTRRRK